MDNIRVTTTQNVGIDFQVASIGERLLSAIIDYAIFFAWYMLALVAAGMMRFVGVWFFIVALLPVVLYNLLCEIFFNGQNVGKAILKLRVVRVDGTEPTIGNYFTRWVFRIVDSLILIGAVATVTIIVNGKGQRLGDMAAGTTVIRQKKKVTLQDTMYRQVTPDYRLTFENVNLLADADIETIREVLMHFRRNYSRDGLALLEKTKKAVERKMGVVSEMRAVEFLDRVLSDYNFINRDN
ncbi:MAG: RDD family protein [Bacteroidetes bacterium]|nr:RDD family protein [Bacteroidota bacterium]MBU1719304.1 RDD family protein [Bacteroidota bacterium]